MNRNLREVAIALSWVLGGLVSSAYAGQVDAGRYLLNYDDALGTPTITSAGGIATYTFASYFRTQDSEVGHVFAEDTFAASLTAAAGMNFAVRADATFPVWAAIAVSGFAAYPQEGNAPNPGPYPLYAYDSSGWAQGEASVTAGTVIVADTSRQYHGMGGDIGQNATNSAVPGAVATAATVTLRSYIIGDGSSLNIWYCPGCQYLGPEDPLPPFEWLGMTSPGPIHVEATFTPFIQVDERFVTGVPEPSTYALMLSGLAGLCVLARRRISI